MTKKTALLDKSYLDFVHEIKNSFGVSIQLIYQEKNDNLNL
jgi:hypothetical protein